MPLSIDDGRTIIGLARSTLDQFVTKGLYERKSWSSGFLSEKRGVFSTLNLRMEEGDALRGCIGFPYPTKRLCEALQEATVSAASQDPRFEPVRPQELDKIVVEVSVLTLPEVIQTASRIELPKLVSVGTDGLIVSTGLQSGLLLPQVAVENGMNSEEFLSQTCMKAGLLPDSWLDKRTAVQKFQAEIFGEATPRGEVRRFSV
jgi:uncharacterized protein (TIGR00296 family)